MRAQAFLSLFIGLIARHVNVGCYQKRKATRDLPFHVTFRI